jgi:alkanesulfonate monooxygenase SsuD/methylene tetrahydromethanopterin reductase-like flavin-dependent oxidoreductase (luciferase family)
MFGDVTLEQALELGLFVCGSPKTVLAAFESYWKELRFGNLLVMCQFGTLPAELTRKNLELFAREVMPALKRLS